MTNRLLLRAWDGVNMHYLGDKDKEFLFYNKYDGSLILEITIHRVKGHFTGRDIMTIEDPACIMLGFEVEDKIFYEKDMVEASLVWEDPGDRRWYEVAFDEGGFWFGDEKVDYFDLYEPEIVGNKFINPDIMEE